MLSPDKTLVRVLTLARVLASSQWGPGSTQVRVGGAGSPLPDTQALANHVVWGVEVLEKELARALPKRDPYILVVVEILLADVDGWDELCFGFHA